MCTFLIHIAELTHGWHLFVSTLRSVPNHLPDIYFCHLHAGVFFFLYVTVDEQRRIIQLQETTDCDY